MADEKKLNTSEYTQEELARIAKIDKLDQNTGRKKLILAGVTVALILIFVIGTIVGGKYILSYEGTEALPTVHADYPTQPEAVAALFSDMLSEVMENDHDKVNRSVSVSIDGDSIEGNAAAVDYIKYVRKELADGMAQLYADFKHDGTYGEDSAQWLPKLYYNPSVCSISAEENPDNAGEIRLKGVYDIACADDLEDMFCFSMDDELCQKTENKTAGIMTITNIRFLLTDAELSAGYERDITPNVLNDITLTKKYHVTFTAFFSNAKADSFSEDCSFDLTVTNRYQFSRVTFRFNDDIIYIEKGDTGEFKYTLVADESPADTVITIESENTDAVSIDKYGYYKGHIISDTPVIITGSYTYMGKTYTDTVQVLVRTPVEDVKLSEKETVMTVGETKTLNITFEPEDAHVKDVKWFSEDDSIATVNENGEITAHKAGEVKVYLISIDGNYKRGCTVTVTEEGGNGNG